MGARWRHILHSATVRGIPGSMGGRASQSGAAPCARSCHAAASACAISFGRTGSQPPRTRVGSIFGQAGGRGPGCSGLRQAGGGCEAARASWHAGRLQASPTSCPAGWVQGGASRRPAAGILGRRLCVYAAGRIQAACWEGTGATAGKGSSAARGVPYTSLMDALSRATPSMLTEAEKSARRYICRR